MKQADDNEFNGNGCELHVAYRLTKCVQPCTNTL